MAIGRRASECLQQTDKRFSDSLLDILGLTAISRPASTSKAIFSKLAKCKEVEMQMQVAVADASSPEREISLQLSMSFA